MKLKIAAGMLFFALLVSIAAAGQSIPENPPPTPRNDLFISGVYPHLTVYGVYSQNGAHYLTGHDECGIGAVVPWAGKLWMVNYAPHMPRGSEHKLYSIDAGLESLTIHPESVGGTPAGRMIHEESQQLFIGHYAIDATGTVRAISPDDMPIRVTAIVRHLEDPANKIYHVDMEGSIWEADVHTLAVTRLFKKPVPGWHAKGAYSSQGRLVMSNNGEHAAGTYDDLLVGGPAADPEERGVLAEWDGEAWRIVERRQYTEVTGPAGIAGGSDGGAPIWAIGWDRRSLRLKVLDGGTWHTYLLPKASFCNDASHGWYTEWPRIREITGGRWMMDMHGMFFDFPKSFSAGDSGGLRPVGSHLRYIPDFCDWNGRLVLATDETSIQGNPLAGQPQTNLWFGDYEDLKTWGPAQGYGGPWIEDRVEAGVPSDPFLVAGFDRRILHLATGHRGPRAGERILRATDQQEVVEIPDLLAGLPRVTVMRGDWRAPSRGYSFSVNQPVTVYLAVDVRGNPQLALAWRRTEMALKWGSGGNYADFVYARDFPAGRIGIPANTTEHSAGAYGMPHTAFVEGTATLRVEAHEGAAVTIPEVETGNAQDTPLRFTLEVDARGNGNWTEHAVVVVPAKGYANYAFAPDFDAQWLRIVPERDCIATAVLHQTSARYPGAETAGGAALFAGLAEVGDATARGARLYPAKRNRNLRVIANGERFFEFSKAGFTFEADAADSDLDALLDVDPEFSVDAASVVFESRGERLRLPKGSAVFDAPFAGGWPRVSREVESERHLANIHGTFYEVPLIMNGTPPDYRKMRPVAGHTKNITDYCSWNGLLVLAGVRANAENDGHVFADADAGVALWFGGIDDLWKLGKPTGHGGPWKDTPVRAGVPSDPYLMTGYDRKTLTLSATVDTRLRVEIDFDHQSGWHHYASFDVTAGVEVEHIFPEGFSAHWVRFVADSDCRATAQLVYE